MQLFFDPSLKQGSHELRAEEVRHLKVLRKSPGDRIDLIDGRGGWYLGTIEELTKRSCMLSVELAKQETRRAATRTTLLLSPTKNTDRLEWALEKCTEIGVDRIVPILTEHAERRRIRTDRLARVLEAAMKQSLTAWMPRLDELTPLQDALTLTESQTGYLAYLGGNDTPLLRDTVKANRHVVLAIGPEGGFSPAEAELARAHGFTWVSLGPKRLRTETAAVCGVHTLEMMKWHA